jgi:hypothetical protein
MDGLGVFCLISEVILLKWMLMAALEYATMSTDLKGNLKGEYK